MHEATVDDNLTTMHNARAWNNLARQNVALTRPVSDEDLRDPLGSADPLGWLGSTVAGKQLLCLAAGGGRQSVLYAAAGAHVTVVDISDEMLARDRAVAAERRLAIRAVQSSMENLSMFDREEFDIVVQPVSTCYVPDVQPVYRQIARVLRSGGLYISQHKSPTSLQAELKPAGRGYELTEPYYRTGALPASPPSRVREVGTVEFLHRWEELLGGMCRAGFVIEDLVEPFLAQPSAERGTFGHRCRYVAPYLRIKARRCTAAASGPTACFVNDT